MLLRKTHFCYNLQMILIIKTMLLNSFKKTNFTEEIKIPKFGCREQHINSIENSSTTFFIDLPPPPPLFVLFPSDQRYSSYINIKTINTIL